MAVGAKAAIHGGRAVRALALSERAEAIERSLEDPEIVRANIARYRSSAPTQTEGTGNRLSLVRMASAGLVHTKGLGSSLCSLR
jgi:hypothetical protein